jgi:hypothetical protein
MSSIKMSMDLKLNNVINIKQNQIAIIPIGLGDLFITRLIYDTYPEINDYIVVNLKIIKDFRNNNQEYEKFIRYLMLKLFRERSVNYEYINNPLSKLKNYSAIYSFKNDITNIKKYFDTSKLFDYKYLVFHTKLRLFSDNMNRKDEFLIKFTQFTQSFKSKFKIILLGEKRISDNQETKIHNIISVYNILRNLKLNNNVIDLTETELYNTPNKEKFEKDIRIISNAECNIGLGWGGNFNMCWAVTDKFKFFVDNVQHPILTFFEKNNKKQIYRTIDSLIDDTLSQY